MKHPTKPGFYWARWHDCFQEDEPLIVELFSDGVIQIAGEGYHYKITDFIWFHLNPLPNPPARHSAVKRWIPTWMPSHEDAQQ